jgi:hypothetical protein
MRTTITIEPDTEALLREEARRTGLSFKEVLNRSVRRSLLRPEPHRVALTPLFKHPFPVAFETISMNRLADALDDEETLNELLK